MVRYADVVHSVDRVRLVDALSAAVLTSRRAGRELGCLVQVALDLDVTDGVTDPVTDRGARDATGARGGVSPNAVDTIAEAVAAAPGLRLDGVMTVAPLAGRYAGHPRDAFDRLTEISSRLRARHPAATMVSAGMSADLEDAIAAGATHVRIGSAVLGVRARLG